MQECDKKGCSLTPLSSSAQVPSKAQQQRLQLQRVSFEGTLVSAVAAAAAAATQGSSISGGGGTVQGGGGGGTTTALGAAGELVATLWLQRTAALHEGENLYKPHNLIFVLEGPHTIGRTFLNPCFIAYYP